MYVDKLFDENIGPIEKVNINFPFKEDGTPKPVIIVGENGSGKSTLLSNIVDALYSIANEQFQNAMKPVDNGGGHQYYKTISPTEIKVGKEYLYSHILFKNNPLIHYIFKSGKLSVADIKAKDPNGNVMPFSWEVEGNAKSVNANKADVEKIFQTDAICYFGPDRYEKPMWMGRKYFNPSDDFGLDENHLHPTVQANWTGVLKNPISIKNVTEVNLQWLMDVIVDSRSDIKADHGKYMLDHVDLNNLMAMGAARKNLETILGDILGTDVYFALNYRDGGASRLKVVEHNTNKIIAPTLDSLSTGQIALFNMFSTIVRYADSTDLNKSIFLKDISGVVVIDEIELHLHTSLQKEVLPKLIKRFPKVQFIITSHAPLFLLGMQKAFGDDGFEVYDMPTAKKISVERFSEFQHAYEYFKTTETYQKDAESAIEKVRSALTSKILVITEGATDWKLMKTAMSVLKERPENMDLFAGLEFSFLEYEPKNSLELAPIKLGMGNTTLSGLCDNYAKIPRDTIYIFIADCDDNATNAKMRDPKGAAYKKWSSNVYSFTIPVPESRIDTPNISIEHLFSDDEIKTEIVCEDGSARRLYMGNEFDQYGHAQSIDRFCERKDICGPSKINIIEGSQGDKIYSFKNPGGINYALPKMRFAKYVSNNPTKFNFDNFIGIFKTIKMITKDGVS